MDEKLIEQRMMAFRHLRLKRHLQNAFRRKKLAKGALREYFSDEFIAAVNMPSAEALLVRLADFTEEQARFLCAEPDTN